MPTPIFLTPSVPLCAGNKEFAELLMTAAEITRAQMQQRTVVGMLMAQCVPRVLFVGAFISL